MKLITLEVPAMVRAAIVVALPCALVAAPSQTQDKFNNPTAGISLSPPTG